MIVAGLLLAFAAGPATAQEDVETLARQGQQLFAEGRYIEAADVLLQAYNIQPVPVLLYNVARAYEEADRCVLASQFFLEYLDSGDTQARSNAEAHEPAQTECADEYRRLMTGAQTALASGNADEAEQLVSQAIETSDEPGARILFGEVLYHKGGDSCDDAVTYLDEVAQRDDLTDSDQAELERIKRSAEECVSDRECSEERADCEAERQRLLDEAAAAAGKDDTLAFIIGGAGIAVLAGAVIHDIAIQGTIDDYERAAAGGNRDRYNELRDDLSTAKTVSYLLYGVGIAATATGVVLYLVGGEEPPPVELDCTDICWDWGVGMPTGDAGFWLGGTF
jgi:hypothetical protein